MSSALLCCLPVSFVSIFHTGKFLLVLDHANSQQCGETGGGSTPSIAKEAEGCHAMLARQCPNVATPLLHGIHTGTCVVRMEERDRERRGCPVADGVQVDHHGRVVEGFTASP